MDPDKLEKNIQQLLLMPTEKKATLGKHARTWFEENDSTFRRKLTQTLEDILKS